MGASDGIDEWKKQPKEVKDEKNNITTAEEDCERSLQDRAKDLERLLSNQRNLLATQDLYLKKIRELGPLSSDAFDTKCITGVLSSFNSSAM